MNTTIPASLSKLEEKKKDMLGKTDSVLITDAWKNSSNNSKLLVFTLRNINGNQIYLKFNDTSEEPQDSDHVCRHIVDAIKLAKTRFQTNVFAINTDNDKTMKAAVRKSNLILKRENIKPKELWETTCYSHSENLLLGSIVTEEFQFKLRDIVTAFSSARMCQLLFRYGGCKLKNYPDTRFCYIRLTCDCILKSWNAMATIIQQGNGIIPENVKNLIKSDDFHRSVLEIITLITPICKLINYCQNPETTLADGTERWLAIELNTDEFDEKIAARIVEAIWPVGYAAYYMHHVYGGMLLDPDQTHVAEEFLKEQLNEKGRQELVSYLKKRETLKRENLPDKVADSFKDAFLYWSFLELDYPCLGKVVKSIMLIPASTASLESYFSVWTHVHKYRNKLKNENGAKLVEINYLCKHLDGNFWKNSLNNRKRCYQEEEEYY